MRRQGSAIVNPNKPQALAICDRCGRRTNHYRLSWQYQWIGPKLQNIRALVCDEGCLDVPQEQLRTIVLPPDPIPIKNARPEFDVQNDNPLSAVGVNENWFLPQYGSRIGNLTWGGGINSAFDGNAYKPSWQSACNDISNSSYNNYVGINWTGNVSQLNMPSSLKPPTITHTVTSFTITAPTDRSFLGNNATSYVVQAAQADTSIYSAWTTISSGATAGTAGESITANCGGPKYQFHRVAFLGDQVNYVSVAQVKFNVGEVDGIVTAGSS